ncbi:MAG: TauD/TfdA dioxygenase family protein [Acetobacteraceae bacterium]
MTAPIIRPLGTAIGADVEGVDLTDLDDAQFAAIEEAWHRYAVLRFRNQKLSDPALMAFSQRFGQLDRVPVRAAGVLANSDPLVAVAPEAQEWVNIISNVKVDGKAVGGLANLEAHWHSDMTYNEIPPKASALYALEVPPTGGNTSFAGMTAAYETLDHALKQRIAGLTCIHDSSRNSVGELRMGFTEVSDPSQCPGARHPLVIAHPVTGQKALYLGRRLGAYVVGLGLADSEALLDELWAHATKPEFCWTQVWRVGDLVMWDNRCVLHRRDDFDDRYRRVMHRTQICGEKPF